MYRHLSRTLRRYSTRVNRQEWSGATSTQILTAVGVSFACGYTVARSEISNPFRGLLLDSAPTIVERNRDEGTDVSLKELSLHVSKDSAWVAIGGHVWDVTDFIESHPGGEDILLQHAGEDVTETFQGIHPKGTLENNALLLRHIGKLQPQSDDAATMAARATVANQDLSLDTVMELPDFERIAQARCGVSAWEYYSATAETGNAFDENHAVYERVSFRPRVMKDVREVDLSTSILGRTVALPFYIAPTARNGLAHPMGEIAATKAAGTHGILQVVSHVASKGLDEIVQECVPGQKVAWQMYMKPDRSLAEAEIRQAVERGASSIWLTVDTTILPKHTLARKGANMRSPASSKSATPTGETSVATLSPRHDAGLTWQDVSWIKSIAPNTPLVLKGIGAWEDAVLAKQYGADAVVLSNHGGRSLDFANAPLRTLRDISQHAPSVIEDKTFQIYVDGGIRRGTDILKALCLGADAVGIGRPFIYAAAAGGEEGSRKAIRILQEELEISMRLLGVQRLEELGSHLLDVSRL